LIALPFSTFLHWIAPEEIPALFFGFAARVALGLAVSHY
jgi:hypothetical protein